MGREESERVVRDFLLKLLFSRMGETSAISGEGETASFKIKASLGSFWKRRSIDPHWQKALWMMAYSVFLGLLANLFIEGSSLAATGSLTDATSGKPSQPDGCLGSAGQSDVSDPHDPVFVELAHKELFPPGTFLVFFDSESFRPGMDKLRVELKIDKFPTTGAEAEFQAAMVKTFGVMMNLVPLSTWETRLARFYGSHLGVEEARVIMSSYEKLDDTPLRRRHHCLRNHFLEEMLDFLRDRLKEQFRSFNVPSGGMVPTLIPGDAFLVDKLAYRMNSPRRGDVIAFKFPEDETKIFVKRIIGLPNDRIELKDKVVYLNETALNENYVQHTDAAIVRGDSNPRDNFGPYEIPEGSFFVLGDNREESLDSRFWGPLAGSLIVGKIAVIHFSWDALTQSPRSKRIGLRVNSIP